MDPKEGQPQGNPEDPKTEEPKGEPYIAFKTEEEHDNYLKRMLKDRLKRKDADIQEILEKEREEREREARQKVLKEQEDWKKLASEHAETIEQRDKRLSELESVEAERDSANERITSLEKRLQGILKPQLERVPELFRGDIEAKTPEEQAEWFEKNGDKLEALSQKPGGSPAAGRAQKNGGADTEQAKNARNAQRSVSRI